MCIIDANIIFDFVAGGILEALFRLEYKFVSTDFVIYEIKSIEQSGGSRDNSSCRSSDCIAVDGGKEASTR